MWRCEIEGNIATLSTFASKCNPFNTHPVRTGFAKTLSLDFTLDSKGLILCADGFVDFWTIKVPGTVEWLEEGAGGETGARVFCVVQGTISVKLGYYYYFTNISIVA